MSGTPERGQKPATPACRCKKGSWSWRVQGATDPVTGARHQPSRSGYGTKAAAQEALSDQIEALRRGATANDKRQTLKTWLTKWLEEGKWEPTTRVGYERHVRLYLIPLLGNIRIRDLDRPAIASMLTELGKPRPGRERPKTRGGSSVERLSAETIDGVRRTLRSALTAAQQDGLITINHAAGRFKQIGVRRRNPQWWQPEQLRAFLDFVAGDSLAAAWYLAGLGGLRRSELCGLRWVDVDLTSAIPGVTIRQKVNDVTGPCPICRLEHKGRQIRPGAKSEAGTGRWVPVTKETVRELLAHQAAQEAYKSTIGDHYIGHGLVFAGPKGEPLRPDTVTKRHANLVAAAGLPKIVLHEMRHSAASLLAAAGMPTDLIAIILGHADPEVTRAVYLHGMRGQLGAGAEAAAGLMREDVSGGDADGVS